MHAGSGALPSRRALRALLASAALALAAAPAAAADPPAIRVPGAGQVAAPPDTAHVTAGVTSQAPTAAEAVRANNQAMQQVLAALEAAGIPKTDVQTANFSVFPVYGEPSATRQRPTIEGYRASNQVVVRVAGIEKVGGVLDKLVSAGANEMGSLSLSVGQPAPLLDEARRRALADARRRAEVYAAAAGVRLGRLLAIEESGGGGPGPVPFARMEAAAAPPIEPGQVELTIGLFATYAIEP